MIFGVVRILWDRLKNPPKASRIERKIPRTDEGNYILEHHLDEAHEERREKLRRRLK